MNLSEKGRASEVSNAERAGPPIVRAEPHTLWLKHGHGCDDTSTGSGDNWFAPLPGCNMPIIIPARGSVNGAYAPICIADGTLR